MLIVWHPQNHKLGMYQSIKMIDNNYNHNNYCINMAAVMNILDQLHHTITPPFCHSTIPSPQCHLHHSLIPSSPFITHTSSQPIIPSLRCHHPHTPSQPWIQNPSFQQKWSSSKKDRFSTHPPWDNQPRQFPFDASQQTMTNPCNQSKHFIDQKRNGNQISCQNFSLNSFIKFN